MGLISNQKIFPSLIIFLLLVSFVSTASSRFLPQSDIQIDDLSNPWNINGNVALDQFASDNSVAGDGSSNNPYIFANFTLVGTGSETLIEIANTNVHAVITNCNLTGGELGVLFRTVENIEISNCDITNNNNGGILARSSSNLTISNNRIVSNGDFITHVEANGIRFENCSDTRIRLNSISSNSNNGIYTTQDSYRLSIEENNLTDNYIGITAFNTYASLYLLNLILYSVIIGFSVFSSNSLTISSNQFNGNNGSALSLSSCNDSIIENNTIAENELYGVDLFGCRNIEIQRNDFIENNQLQTWGPSQASEDDLGSNNTFYGNYFNEFTVPDVNSDGIVDIPYQIDGAANNSDTQPSVARNNPSSMTPSNHSLSSPVIIAPTSGDPSFSETLFISWEAAYDSEEHTVAYSIDLLNPANETLNSLVDSTFSLEAQIDITELDDGDYRIKLIADDGHGLFSTAISVLFTIENILVVTSTNDGSFSTEDTIDTSSTEELSTDPLLTTNFGIALYFTPFIIPILALYRKHTREE